MRGRGPQSRLLAIGDACTGWVLPAVAAVLWIGAVAWPAVALISALVTEPRSDVEVLRPSDLLLTTTVWAAAVAVGAVVLGWGPGRVLGRALHGRGYLPIAVLMLAPICLPAYVVFYAWYQGWPPTSALYRWAVASGHIQLLKNATLLMGLTCWSWPLVAWCVAGWTASTPAQHSEMVQLDGAGVFRRMLDRLRSDAPGLGLGALIVFLLAFDNTTCFDLAGIWTFGNELRAIGSRGANATDMLLAALPAMLLSAVGATAIWLVLARRPQRPAVRLGRGAAATSILTALILAWSVVVPLALFASRVEDWWYVETFFRLYGRALGGTLTLALVSGGLGALTAAGLAMAWQDQRRWLRNLAHIQAIGWLFTAIIPGTIVGVAFEAAYNRPGLDDLIYSNPIVLIGGYLARFAFIGALLGRWIAMSEPRTLRDLRLIDGGASMRALLGSSWPRYLAAAGATAGIVTVLCVSEIPVTASLHPPGSDPLATAVLDAMHYQRPDVVFIASITTMLLALAAAGVTVVVWGLRRRWFRLVSLAAVGVLLLTSASGCEASDDDQPAPLKTRLTFGRPGLSLGQFNYPRGIAVDPQRELIYIVDKTARVQRFDLHGEPQLQWRMPQWENGKPTGLNVAPDGRVFVADTHYHRVIAYDPDGRELMRFGRYGQGPGEFIYPTDVAFGPQGRIYVSEYGGNDRVQVFSAQGEFLFGFGSFGSQAGQFNRPQAMTFNASKSELYIADACNHRIVVCDGQGTLLRVIGGPGRGPSELAYPYDVMVLGDGSLLVVEFGNNRIQHLSATGECRGLFGRAGTDEGELQYPWGIDGVDEAIFVLDSGNNRVQVIRSPR